MPNYGLVAQSINNLADRIGRTTDRQLSHEEAMSDLGLRGAQLDIQSKDVQGQQSLNVAKMKRQQFLEEPVTIGEAIETHPKWTPEQKKTIMGSIPEDVRGEFLGHITSRGNLINAIGKLKSEQKEAIKEKNLADYRSQMLGLAKARVDASGNKPPSMANQKYTDEVSLQNLMGKYGLREDLNGGITGDPISQEQAQILQQEAEQMGLNVYFDQGEIEDEGSGWNPFDNKTVQSFRVRAIAPSGGVKTGLAPSGQQAQQAQNTPLAGELEGLLNRASVNSKPEPKTGLANQPQQAITNEAPASGNSATFTPGMKVPEETKQRLNRASEAAKSLWNWEGLTDYNKKAARINAR